MCIIVLSLILNINVLKWDQTVHHLIHSIFYPPSMESPFDCLFLQIKQSAATTTRTRMTITPITIPAMAPPDSPPPVPKSKETNIHTNTVNIGNIRDRKIFSHFYPPS